MIYKNNGNKDRVSYIFFIMVMFLFEPKIFVKYNTLNYIYIFGAICSFGFILTKIFKNSSFRISRITFALIIYRTWVLLITVINKGDILNVGYYSVVFISLFLYGDYFAKNKKLYIYISMLNKIFFIYLLINIVLYLIYPNGLYHLTQMHFLGIRTRFTEYAITSILLVFLNYKINKEKRLYVIIQILVVILNIILPKISTAITGLAVFVVGYLILQRFKNFDYRIFLILGILLSVLVVFFGIQNIFSNMIMNVFSKDITFSGRTYIWNSSFNYIFDNNILWGHGQPIDGNFVKLGNTLWQSHNQLLQILYENGLVGAIIFYYLIYLSLKKLNNDNGNKINKLLAIIQFVYLIMMITEIYGYYISYYTVIIISYYCSFINVKDNYLLE